MNTADSLTHTVQVEEGFYDFETYMTRERWQSYWYQLNAILKYRPKSVLEIGCGTGATTQMLRKAGVEVTTFDFDRNLEPDICGDVREIQSLVGSKVFDLVCAFQVLEHIPYQDFQSTVSQLGKIARNNVIISLPHWGYPLEVRLSFLKKRFSFAYGRKLTRPLDWSFDGQHHWELGTNNHSLKTVRRAIARELDIISEYFCPDYSYHYFFELSASKD